MGQARNVGFAGGGLGRIVLNTIDGASPTIGTMELSPPESSDAFRVLNDLGVD